MKTAIVGAGISGLSVARFLKERGHDPVVFEASPCLAGGLMESRHVDGYTFDVGGGHILYTKDGWIESLVRELYADGGLGSYTRNTKIFHKGRFVKYPFENGLSDLPPQTNFECLLGYIEAYMQRKGAQAPAAFRDWILYRMGEGIARHFMIPYNEKIWCCDLREMGVEWVSGRVPEAPLEDILRSSLGIPTEGYTHQAVFSYPERGGIQDLADRMARPIEGAIRYSHAVEHIEKKGDARYEVDGEEFAAVVFTAPLDQAPRIVSGMETRAARAASSLEHLSLTSFLFGIQEEEARPYSWVYLPFPEDGPVNRLTYLSNYSPYNAPPGKASILAEVTHRGPLHVDHDYVRELRRALTKNGFLKKDAVTVEAHGRMEYAYIFYDREFVRKRALALEGLTGLGIHPLGRFGQYGYFNMDHCILEARAVADRIDQELK